MSNRSSLPASPRPVRATSGADADKSTRERILDIALDLFIEKGFDKTSLREIAEHLGFSKAALYYHFASKDEILLSLHRRLFAVAHGILDRLGEDQGDLDAWAASLEQVVDEMVAHRRLFVMRERNRAAFEQLQRASGVDPDDPEQHLRRLLADPTVPIEGRVRLACSMGAIMGGLMPVGNVFADVSSDSLAEMLREAVRELRASPPAAPRRPSPEATGPPPRRMP